MASRTSSNLLVQGSAGAERPARRPRAANRTDRVHRLSRLHAQRCERSATRPSTTLDGVVEGRTSAVARHGRRRARRQDTDRSAAVARRPADGTAHLRRLRPVWPTRSGDLPAPQSTRCPRSLHHAHGARTAGTDEAGDVPAITWAQAGRRQGHRRARLPLDHALLLEHALGAWVHPLILGSGELSDHIGAALRDRLVGSRRPSSAAGRPPSYETDKHRPAPAAATPVDSRIEAIMSTVHTTTRSTTRDHGDRHRRGQGLLRRRVRLVARRLRARLRGHQGRRQGDGRPRRDSEVRRAARS